MIKINENNSEKISEILNVLRKRGYRVYSSTSSAIIDFDITGRWKGFKSAEISPDYIAMLDLIVGFDLRLDRFCATLSLRGETTSGDRYSLRQVLGMSVWDKYYDPLYKLVKPLGFEKPYDKLDLITMNYPYTDEFIDKYIYSLDDGVKKLVPRIKGIMQPPKRKGRI